MGEARELRKRSVMKAAVLPDVEAREMKAKSFDDPPNRFHVGLGEAGGADGGEGLTEKMYVFDEVFGPEVGAAFVSG